ncbi:GPP34 family phosphoprotein [Streptomyces sp. NPDC048606]|uniref:GPP34 family phosphoprotein n=1 Tax=Streptomyces sp. NPDC048606 TaxID=3154726 RepID=UPI00343B4FCB
MSTAKDLFIIAMDPRSQDRVGQGDLSLALAGAELIDLIGARAVTVDGDRIVPGEPPAEAPADASVPDDALLGEAASALVREKPFERIEDWLWRRGRDLSAAYRKASEAEGQLRRRRGGRLPFGPEQLEVVDTPARRRAEDRKDRGEPVLAELASAVGVDGARSASEEGGGAEPGAGADLGGEAVTTVLAVVHDAVMELEAVRRRRNIENTAFANIWRVP